MSNRVECVLTLQRPHEIDETLDQLLRRHLDEPEDSGESPSWRTFTEIRYGILPIPVQDYLVTRKIPFAWKWDRSGEFSDGVTLYHPDLSAEPVDWGLQDGSKITASVDVDRDVMLSYHKFYEELWRG